METFLTIVILTAIISFSLFGKHAISSKSAISEIEDWVKDDEEDKKTK